MKRILVVDDDFDLVSALKRLLKEKYYVDVALGGGAALRKLQKDHYDLVLMDFYMPALNGAGVVERLQDLGIKTPVILMSAVPVLMNSSTIGLHVAGRMPKPFDLAELEARIVAVLGPEETPKKP
jgi:DNA-binding response OmpR family regulator